MKSDGIKRDRCQDCLARCESAFANLSENDLSKIDRIRTLVEFNKKSVLPLEFESQRGFYCIRSGHLRANLTNGGHTGTISICGPGDILGYHLQDDKSVYYESFENGFACYFFKSTFHTLQTLSPTLADGIIKILCKMISTREQTISRLENHTVKNRIASLLLNLAESYGVHSKYGTKIDLKLDRETIAKLAGTGPESLARTLTEFEEDQLIFRDGRKIHLIDLNALKTLSHS